MSKTPLLPDDIIFALLSVIYYLRNISWAQKVSKPKLFALSTERLRRQHVQSTMQKAQQIALAEKAQGVIVILQSEDGRTIIRSAGSLHNHDAALLELLRVTIKASIES